MPVGLRRASLGLAIVVLCATGGVARQAPAAPSPEQIVREWFEAWNALGADPSSVDRLLALYAPSALHITGPTEDQRGTATYRGHDGLRVLAARVAATEDRRAYRIETETAREQTTQLMHLAQGPWGDVSIGVQFVGVSTGRASGTREVTPGAAFFQFEGGRIRRARVYLASAERAEVEAEPKKKGGR